MKGIRLLAIMVLILFPQWISAQNLPYPASQVISGIAIDWSTHQRHAVGSDNFQLTWADDGHQYGIWGDGGGFTGTNSKYRVAFGVARIEGDFNNYKGFDFYGHKESAENEAKLEGKSWALLSVNGDLYCWVHPDKPEKWGSWDYHHTESRLFRSKNNGASWQAASWAFSPGDDIVGGAILQFGKNYAGAMDDYVYHYFVHPNIVKDPVRGTSEIMAPGIIYLARVHRKNMMERDAYKFFAGLKGGEPVWVEDVMDKKPVFVDENGVGTPMGISYNAGLKRILLSTGHSKGHSGQLGIFEAPAPWGSWSTVSYATNTTWFGHDYNPDIVPPTSFFWCLPTKWISKDGRSASIVFTGGWEPAGGPWNDSFNTVRVRFLEP